MYLYMLSVFLSKQKLKAKYVSKENMPFLASLPLILFS